MAYGHLLEPGGIIGNITGINDAQLSMAISLKRIAEYLKVIAENSTPPAADKR